MKDMSLKAKELVTAMGQTLDIGSLALNDKGMCFFKYHDHFDFVIEAPPSTDTFFLYASLLSLPSNSEDKVLIYEKLLEHNYLCIDTHGATFAIDRKNNSLILCYWHKLQHLELQEFISVVIRFLQTADEHWETLNKDFKPSSQGQSDIAAFLASQMKA